MTSGGSAAPGTSRSRPSRRGGFDEVQCRLRSAPTRRDDPPGAPGAWQLRVPSLPTAGRRGHGSSAVDDPPDRADHSPPRFPGGIPSVSRPQRIPRTLTMLMSRSWLGGSLERTGRLLARQSARGRCLSYMTTHAQSTGLGRRRAFAADGEARRLRGAVRRACGGTRGARSVGRRVRRAARGVRGVERRVRGAARGARGGTGGARGGTRGVRGVPRGASGSANGARLRRLRVCAPVGQIGPASRHEDGLVRWAVSGDLLVAEGADVTELAELIEAPPGGRTGGVWRGSPEPASA